MKRDRLCLFIAWMLLFSLITGFITFPSSLAADTIIVAPNPADGDYTSIQSAIDNAQAGDTILVLAGTYSEVILVNKSLSIISESVDAVLIDGGSAESVVTITSTWVNLTNFSVLNSFSSGSGILAIGISHLNLSGNYITQVGNGIHLVDVRNSMISNNTVYDSQLDGLRVQSGSNNIFRANLLSSSDGYGINLTSSNDNLVFHNNLLANTVGASDDSSNFWNWSYPFGGNCWSDLDPNDLMGGPDQDILGSDGIVDDPYTNISGGMAMDHFPLASSWPFSDTFEPVLRLNSPSNDSMIMPGVAIDFDAWDMNLLAVSYHLDGVFISELSDPYLIDSSSWSDGVHNVSIEANDTLGNVRYLNLTYTADSTAPTVMMTSPVNGSNNVSLETPIFVVFSESIDPPTIDVDSVLMSPHLDLTLALWENDTNLSVATSEALSYSTSYELTLTSAITDLVGNPLEEIRIVFSTEPVPEGIVRGTLLDVYGDPVEEVQVVFNDTEGTTVGNTTTDVDGSFNITLPFNHYNMTALKDGEIILETEVEVDWIGPIELGDMDTMWDPGVIDYGSVIGRLLDVNEDPVNGAEVSFRDSEGDTVASEFTEEGGGFNITVPYGLYNITAVKENETILDEGVNVTLPSIDLGDIDTMWDPGPLPQPPFDPTIPLLVLIILIIIGILGYLGIRKWGEKPPRTFEERSPIDIETGTERAEEPSYLEPELRGPMVTRYSPPGREQPPAPSEAAPEGKGRPCREIMEDRGQSTLGEATANAREAQRRAEEARRAAEEAERAAEEARRRADGAEESVREAEEEFDREVTQPKERARQAEERVRDIERRLQEMRENIPGGDGISFEPRPGWIEGGIGLGDMLRPISIWYRDQQTWNEHADRLRDIYYNEYKPLKAELETARSELEEARRAAEEAATKEQRLSQRIEGLRQEAEETRRAAEEAERAAEEAKKAAEQAREEEQRANEAVENAREEADQAEGQARLCEECLNQVQALLEEIARLRERYEELLSGDDLREARDQLVDIDAEEVWDSWWDSFKRFRDEVKAMADIKNLTDADLPSEFTGIWNWGGPVGTAVGYGVEDVAGAVIPTYTINAVGELYRVFQALFDPDTALGARILMEQLGATDAPKAADAFNDFPDVMRDAIESFEKLEELRGLENEISSLLNGWGNCLDALPEVPDMPIVDLDSLCLEQCRDIRDELEELKDRLENLIEQAENCRPEGLDDKFGEVESLKRQLRGISGRMDRTREGLQLYRRAYSQHFKSRGCFISTAVYGTSLAPELDTLRWFRDELMGSSPFGKILVKHYLRFSPETADRMISKPLARENVAPYVALSLSLIRNIMRSGKLSRSILTGFVVVVYALGCLKAWLLTRGDIGE
jgi:parallel beta-helix repeat protein